MTMVSFVRQLWVSALVVLCSTRAYALPPIDIVFDLDWTLFSTIPADQKLTDLSQVTTVHGIRYRLSDGVVEALNLLRKYPHVRISVFSGGEAARNEALLRAIILDPNGPVTAYDILHQRLSFTNLTLNPNVPPRSQPKFSERWKKNLAPYFKNLERTILIDDSRAFAALGQERNLYWVGPTYDFFETYADVEKIRAQAPQTEYLPNSADAWKIERNRIPTTALLLEEAIQAELKPGARPKPWIDRLNELAAGDSRSKRVIEWDARLPLLQGRCAEYVKLP